MGSWNFGSGDEDEDAELLKPDGQCQTPITYVQNCDISRTRKWTLTAQSRISEYGVPSTQTEPDTVCGLSRLISSRLFRIFVFFFRSGGNLLARPC